MANAASRYALQDAEVELYRAQVAILELRTVLQELWDQAQYPIYYRVLSLYKTSVTHLYRAAFDIQTEQYAEQYSSRRNTPNISHAVVAFDDTESL
jgi:hypothetical protein